MPQSTQVLQGLKVWTVNVLETTGRRKWVSNTSENANVLYGLERNFLYLYTKGYQYSAFSESPSCLRVPITKAFKETLKKSFRSYLCYKLFFDKFHEWELTWITQKLILIDHNFSLRLNWSANNLRLIRLIRLFKEMSNTSKFCNSFLFLSDKKKSMLHIYTTPSPLTKKRKIRQKQSSVFFYVCVQISTNNFPRYKSHFHKMYLKKKRRKDFVWTLENILGTYITKIINR